MRTIWIIFGLETELILVPFYLLFNSSFLSYLDIQNDFKHKLPPLIAKLDSKKELNIRPKRILKSAYKSSNDDLSDDNCSKLIRSTTFLFM
jgi:hypothetical protein